jgi:hypothetical protein
VTGGFTGAVGCNAEMTGIAQFLSAPGARVADSIGRARLVMSALKSPAYASWQACRDRADYITRPRNF